MQIQLNQSHSRCPALDGGEGGSTAAPPGLFPSCFRDDSECSACTPPCSKQVIDRLNGCSIARKSRWRAQRENSAHSNGPLGLTGGHSCPHTVQLHNSSEHGKRKEKKAEREGDKERTCSLVRATEAKHSASHNSPCITFNEVLATASRQFLGCCLTRPTQGVSLNTWVPPRLCRSPGTEDTSGRAEERGGSAGYPE